MHGGAAIQRKDWAVQWVLPGQGGDLGGSSRRSGERLRLRVVFIGFLDVGRLSKLVVEIV